MRGYHFTSLEAAKSILSERRLRLSLYENVNDPYELLGIDLSDDEFRVRYLNWAAEMSRDYAIISFGEEWFEPIMWSHYADRHRGVCIGFDLNDDKVARVTYIDQRMEYVRERLEGPHAERRMLELLASKHRAWSYEREVRYHARRAPLYEPFDEDLVLKEVILGVRCSPEADAVLRGLADGIDPAVDVFRAKLSTREFKVERA